MSIVTDINDIYMDIYMHTNNTENLSDQMLIKQKEKSEKLLLVTGNQTQGH